MDGRREAGHRSRKRRVGHAPGGGRPRERVLVPVVAMAPATTTQPGIRGAGVPAARQFGALDEACKAFNAVMDWKEREAERRRSKAPRTPPQLPTAATI